ncbi:hypothetical protein EKD16_19335 [Streptomonospora litoralis]|uniref:Uncharacterized protein n=1 Tax=Streptomonospora litoralis TaxID=2498135 RepID=A0A4P6Q5Q6_9ACTN|nr:hypothetical protein EKD16_19335 [Streptomonospora litoralis]
MRPGRGHEMHVRAAAPASVPPRGASLATSSCDTKEHGVFCPPMPESPAGPRPRCGGGGARGAPNGAKTPPTSTFRAPRGRRVRRGRPQNGHRPPKFHPIGRWGPRRPRPGATSDVSSPPGPRSGATGPCGHPRPRPAALPPPCAGPAGDTATPSRPAGAGRSPMPVHPAMIANLWPRNTPSCDHKFAIDAPSRAESVCRARQTNKAAQQTRAAPPPVPPPAVPAPSTAGPGPPSSPVPAAPHHSARRPAEARPRASPRKRIRAVRPGRPCEPDRSSPSQTRLRAPAARPRPVLHAGARTPAVPAAATPPAARPWR